MINTEENSVQQNIIEMVRDQVGVELMPCDHFTGIQFYNGKAYYNFLLTDNRISESKDYQKIKRFAERHGVISVDPNGLKRISIFRTEQN